MYPSNVDMLALARALGSDVPFFVLDYSAARARGRGEKLEQVELSENHLVLVNPGLPISAKDAYEHLQNFSARLKLDNILDKLNRQEEPGYLNALQPGVVLHYPLVRDVLTVLRKEGLRGVMMSGSGSTCFGLAKTPDDAEAIATQLRARYGAWRVWATHTC
jgi:4-diphosphocytidyl-2-C-methyl-D-erythritol kinase